MSEPLWTFDEALAATGGIAPGGAAPDLTSVSIDSRTIESGALFAAIRGDNLDGYADESTGCLQLCVMCNQGRPGSRLKC